MAIRITCPACDAVHSIGDDRRGTRIKCKSCDKSIAVPDDPDEGAVQESLRPKVKRAANMGRDDDDDDDDERGTATGTAKKAKQGGSSILLIGVTGAIVVAVLLLCVVGVGLGAIFWPRNKVDDQAKQPTKVEPKEEEKKPVNTKLNAADFKFAWGKDGNRHLLVFNHTLGHDLKNVQVTVHWFYATQKANASQALFWEAWRPNETKQQVMTISGRPMAIRLVGRADGVDKLTTFEIDCVIPDPPGALPINNKLTDADLRFSWGVELDRHVLSFSHGQPIDLRNVDITIHWFQSGTGGNSSQRLNYALWRPNEFKQQIMAMRERPKAVRIVGRAQGPNNVWYDIDCPIPDPQPAVPVANPKLTNAHFRFSWAKNADRHFLSFNHGQIQDLRNVQITIHWIQAASGSKASQGLSYGIWRPNETKQQIMGVRELPRSIRILGQAQGADGITYDIDCPITDPP